MRNVKLVSLLVALCLGWSFQGQGLTDSPGERYAGFSAYYAGFGFSFLYPVTPESISLGGHDVTSCLFRRREEFAKLFRKASVEAKYHRNMTRLQVTVDGEQWCVDDTGVVLIEGISRQLSAEDFKALKLLLFQELPLNQTTTLN